MDVFKVSGNGLSNQIAVEKRRPSGSSRYLVDQIPVVLRVPDLRMRFVRNPSSRRRRDYTAEPGTTEITSKKITHVAPYDHANACLRLPARPLVARAQAEVSIPGGCVMAPPIDLHIKGLKKLHCQVDISNGYVHVDASEIKGDPIFLGGRSGSTVTGTANIVMAATLAPGTSRLECAACEPEVVDLCQMLVKMGAKIEGIGSPELVITGVDKLHGCEHSVIADRIEAGTFVIAGAITRGDVTVKGIAPKLLGAFIDKLEEAGLPMELGDDYIRVLPFTGSLKPVDVITLPHPGYPTDLQAQLGALMTQTEGLSIITERIYPNRFMHVPELQRMGADISIEGPSAIIKGASKLSGAPVMASDLRASAALILAAFAAEGDTWIQFTTSTAATSASSTSSPASVQKSSASATRKCLKSCSKSKFLGKHSM